MLALLRTGSLSILRYHLVEKYLEIMCIYKSQLRAIAPGESLSSGHFVLVYVFFFNLISFRNAFSFENLEKEVRTFAAFWELYVDKCVDFDRC